MSVLNPEHLLDQAAALITPPPAGPPRQVDVRRAISAAYYAVFHMMMAEAADTMVGRVHRGTPGYVLVYRSADHKGLRMVCEIAQRHEAPQRYRTFVPNPGFCEDVRALGRAVISLQERRNTADYDPTNQFRTVHGNQAIDLARTALRHWASAPDAERRTFLMLLLFPPR
jgi:hypothetical protein